MRPDRGATFTAEDNVIAGNVIAYGATGGELFVRGIVGSGSACATLVSPQWSRASATTLQYMTGGTVVIIGRTGRNVAAGMSGGIAYVLGLNPSVLNTEMVDLEEPTPADLVQVHALVRRHEEETGSTVAAALLADWATSATRFSKIMPRDYRQVLDAQAAAEQDGRDVLDAIMEAAHG